MDDVVIQEEDGAYVQHGDVLEWRWKPEVTKPPAPEPEPEPKVTPKTTRRKTTK